MKSTSLTLAFCLLSSVAFAQQAPATLQDRVIAVCQEQRNAALNWHANSEAQRVALQEEVSRLQAELAKLKATKQ